MNSRRECCWTVALSCFLLAAATGFAQESGQERPKIGVALGGGGAKGGAHVGVLKVFEELNIPIDYIAGTSIGGIVGGLYATGMSADELAAAIENVDWSEALRDQPPRRDLEVGERKEPSDFGEGARQTHVRLGGPHPPRRLL